MGSPRHNQDQKDNNRIFRWGIAIAVLMVLLVVVYNVIAYKREGALPKPDASPPAAVQQQKP